MLETNKEVCRKLLEQGYGQGDLAAVDEAVSATCRIHDPVFPELQHGSENLKAHIQRLRGAFPNLTCTCDAVMAERNEVVIHWTCRGTQKGAFLNQPASNRAAVLTGNSIFRVTDGKIAEMWSEWNLRTLLDQLGIGLTEQQANKVFVTRFLEEVWNSRQPEKIGHYVAESCTRISPNGMVRGPAGYRQEYDAYITAFPDFHIKVDEMTCEGERVVARFTATGTHDGGLRDLAPTGKTVSFIGVALYHLGGGKIVEQYLTFDDFGLMRELRSASGAGGSQ